MRYFNTEGSCRPKEHYMLKPIINGTGNYYFEAQTRDERRTDLTLTKRKKWVLRKFR